MSDQQILFDFPGADIAFTRTPLYTTRVQNTVSGREVAISYESYPRYQWQLKMNVLRDFLSAPEQKRLEAMFHLVGGRGDYFLFTDPQRSATDGIVDIGTGTGAATQFRIGYLHTDPTYGLTFLEPVQNPAAWTVYVNGVAQVNGTAYTMDPRGLITFKAGYIPAAGATVSWSGSFHYRCRFLNDSLDFQRIVKDMWSSTLKFRSVKV